MKKIIILSILFCLSGGRLFAQPAALDTFQLSYFAGEILDASAYVGVFEVPGPMSGLRPMNNGKIPEDDPAYLNLMMEYGLTKFYTSQTLRGKFDSVIFIQGPAFGTEIEDPSFMPFTTTKWILVLHPCYNGGEENPSNWVGKIKDYSKVNFITPATTFYVKRFRGTALCLRWTTRYQPQDGMITVQNDMIGDVRTIVNGLKESASISGTEFQSKFAAQMKTGEGKLLLTLVSGKK